MTDYRTPTVSAVVVTYRRPTELASCLATLSQQTVPLREVVVVDNGAATADDARQVCEEAPADLGVRYVISTTNSLPAARNLGVSQCSGEFVALVDDDVRLASDYLEAALRVFEERPEAVGVQGYIDPGPRPQWRERLQHIFGLYHLEPDRCRVLPAISTTYPAPLTHTVPCEWISGSNQVYRREVLHQVKWDERLLKYADGEDLDHSFRVYRRYPGRLFITPEARVEHDEVATWRASGYELIAMREVYGWYLLHKLLPGSRRALAAYLWSRIGRLVFAIGVTITPRRRGAWAEVWSILRAYALVCRHSRDFAAGTLRVFNSTIVVSGLDKVR